MYLSLRHVESYNLKIIVVSFHRFRDYKAPTKNVQELKYDDLVIKCNKFGQ